MPERKGPSQDESPFTPGLRAGIAFSVFEDVFLGIEVPSMLKVGTNDAIAKALRIHALRDFILQQKFFQLYLGPHGLKIPHAERLSEFFALSNTINWESEEEPLAPEELQSFIDAYFVSRYKRSIRAKIATSEDVASLILQKDESEDIKLLSLVAAVAAKNGKMAELEEIGDLAQATVAEPATARTPIELFRQDAVRYAKLGAGFILMQEELGKLGHKSNSGEIFIELLYKGYWPGGRVKIGKAIFYIVPFSVLPKETFGL